MIIVLTIDNAHRLVGILIGFLPAGEVHFKGGLKDTVREWPDTDWAAVSAKLREDGSWKIADWLDEAVDEEKARRSRR